MNTNTWQYNYLDISGLFINGVAFPAGTTFSTIARIVQRPYAPITYFNMVYSGLSNDIYTIILANSNDSTSPFVFSSITNNEDEFFESTIVAFSTLTSVVTSVVLSTDDLNTSTLKIYSFTLGYN